MTKRSLIILTLSLLPTCLLGQTDLRVNEVSTGVPSWIEIMNFGASTLDVSAFKIRWGGNSGLNFIQGVYTIPNGTMLAPNGRLVLTEDPALAQPVVPAGVFKAYTGAGIVWVQTPAVGVNGCVAVNDAFDFGLDRMKWGNPLQDLSVYGSPWTGSIAPTAAVMYRNVPTDSDSPADWASSSTAGATPGAINPGEANVIDLVMTTVAGTGNITVDVFTYGPAVPNGEIFNLISLIDSIPNGSGPLFGIGADAFLQATTPIGPGNPFHTNLDGAGHWGLAAPAGSLPGGLHLEAVSILFQGGISRISTVEVITI